MDLYLRGRGVDKAVLLEGGRKRLLFKSKLFVGVQKQSQQKKTRESAIADLELILQPFQAITSFQYYYYYYYYDYYDYYYYYYTHIHTHTSKYQQFSSFSHIGRVGCRKGWMGGFINILVMYKKAVGIGGV